MFKKLTIILFMLISMSYLSSDIRENELPIDYNFVPISEVIIVHPKRETELECLQKNLYFEAASEGEEGMTAVANVVINRMHDPYFPKSACAVTHQYKQFSWYGHRWNPHLNSHTLPTWKMAGNIAKAALRGNLENNVGDCEYFHAVTVQPKWADEKDMVTQIGNHIFYKDKTSIAAM
jgi:spore germination cell wall hydrolase CwlJ-like protein